MTGGAIALHGIESNVMAIAQYYAQYLSNTTVTGSIFLDNDVDGDGKIGLPDAIYVMQVIAGLRSE